MAEPIHIPLVSQFENRSSSPDKDAKIVNGYAEKVGDTAVVMKRPGYGTGDLYAAGAVQGITTYLGVSRVVIGNTFYKTPTTSAAIDAGGLDVDFV